jgi:hypothetical protein
MVQPARGTKLAKSWECGAFFYVLWEFSFKKCMCVCLCVCVCVCACTVLSLFATFSDTSIFQKVKEINRVITAFIGSEKGNIGIKMDLKTIGKMTM